MDTCLNRNIIRKFNKTEVTAEYGEIIGRRSWRKLSSHEEIDKSLFIEINIKFFFIEFLLFDSIHTFYRLAVHKFG